MDFWEDKTIRESFTEERHLHQRVVFTRECTKITVVYNRKAVQENKASLREFKVVMIRGR